MNRSQGQKIYAQPQVKLSLFAQHFFRTRLPLLIIPKYPLVPIGLEDIVKISRDKKKGQRKKNGLILGI